MLYESWPKGRYIEVGRGNSTRDESSNPSRGLELTQDPCHSQPCSKIFFNSGQHSEEIIIASEMLNTRDRELSSLSGRSQPHSSGDIIEEETEKNV